MKLNELTVEQRKHICDRYLAHKCIDCPFAIIIYDDYEVDIDRVANKIRGGHIECAEWLFDSELEDEQISFLTKNSLLSTPE